MCFLVHIQSTMYDVGLRGFLSHETTYLPNGESHLTNEKNK